MLDEELSVSVSECQVNKCRAWLLAEFLRSELECKEPGCTGSHRRDYQIMCSMHAALNLMWEDCAEKVH